MQRQKTDVPFIGGVSTRVDRYQIPFNKLAAARDVVFTRPGETRTRYGYRAFPTAQATEDRFGSSAPITVGQGLFTYENELLLADPLSLYSWDPSAQAWVYKAPCASVDVQARPVVDNAYGQSAPDCNVSANGFRFNAWEDTRGGVWWSITNLETGGVVVAETQVSAFAVKPKVLTFGGRFLLFYVRTDTGRLYLAAVPTADVYQGLTTQPVTSNVSRPVQLSVLHASYDATVIPNANGTETLYVAFADNVASTNAGIGVFGYLAHDLATPAYGVATMTGLQPRQVTIFADTIGASPNGSNGPVIVYSNLASIEAFGWLYDLSANTFGATALEVAGDVIPTITGVSVATDTSVRALDVYWTVANADSSRTLVRSCRLSGATPTVDGLGMFKRSVGLAGKAFAVLQGTRLVSYVPLAYQSTFPASPGFYGLQDTFFLADSTGYLAARFFLGTAGGLPGGAAAFDPSSVFGWPMLPEVSASSPTMFHCALTSADFVTTVGQLGDPATASTFSRTTPPPGTQGPTTAVFTQDGVQAVVFDFFDRQNSYLRAELGQTLLLGGGLLQSYDGQTLTENDFSLFPENLTLVSSNSGGALTSSATYWYCFCWQWTNARGEVQQSAPSVPLPVTLGASDNTVTATVESLRLTAKDGAVLVAYRAPFPGGTVYQQCLKTVVPGATGSVNAPILNDPTADTIIFVDKLSDADIEGCPNLYTTGNVVENLPTPPCSDLTVNYNRLFALDTSNNTIWFSQQVQPGLPVQMTQWFALQVDPRGGRVTAVRALDQHLVIFKESLIMVIDGTGPDATGGQNDFQDAYIVTTDVGCIFPRSIGLGPDGLYFQSAKGIYILTRSLAVVPIGADAMELVDGQEVTSAELISYTQQMRFTLANGTLVGHDYFANQWFEHTNIDAVDGAIWQGTYCYLGPDGTVFQETVPAPGASLVEMLASYSDAGDFVGQQLVTPPYDFGGLSGWARTWWIFILGKVFNKCRIRVDVAYDYGPITQTIYIDAAPGSTYGAGTFGRGTFGGDPPNVVWRVQPNQQLASSMQITLTVEQVKGIIGPGVSLSGLTFEWAQLPTSRRPNTGATYG